MYGIRHSSGYRRALKRLERSGRKKDVTKLEDVIDVLAEGRTLPPQYQDHYLSGALAAFKECHIKHDLLLVYHKDDEQMILSLLKLGSHDELFGG